MTTKRKSPFAGIRMMLLEYVTFTVSERKGIFALLLLQVALLLVLLFTKFTKTKSNADFTRLDSVYTAFHKMYENDLVFHAPIADTLIPDGVDHASNISIDKKTQKLFVFNPNQLAGSLWLLLGLSEKQIKVIRNYESKGGKFYSKADVKKMYCISEKEYAAFEAFINLPETKPMFKTDSTASPYHKKAEEKKPVVITPLEINLANEEDLILLPGIGPGRANAIVKYREKLGGYVELSQVKEAYGMDSVYDAIRPFLLLEVYTTRRMNINTFSALDLKHPYLTPALANIIINYRKVHGDYSSVSDLKKLNVLDEELYKKLAPYLNTR